MFKPLVISSVSQKILLQRSLSTTALRLQSTVLHSPLQRYNSQVEKGRLRDDQYQRGILSNLEGLHSKLINYSPPSVNEPDIADLTPKTGLSKMFGSIFGGGSSRKKSEEMSSDDINAIPHGIYLYGDVGCGKTMLMDLFYDTIPPHLTKRRLHFHQFMQNLHKRSHQLKQKYGGKQDIDVIPLLAWELAQNSTVLCFDEFQVTDVADAMLLRRLINLVLSPNHGLILFATSNRAPDDLYINGIQRESFIPCIQLIKSVTSVIYLNSPTDYRKIPRPISSVYYTPKPGIRFDSPASRKQQSNHIATWYSYFSQGHEREENIPLQIWGREFIVPICSPPYVAQFTFDELCGQPLAAGDYLQLATSFKAIIVTDIPYMSTNIRDKVRRFITFLDAVYDNHGKIAVTAVAPFNDIFVEPEDISDSPYTLKTSSVEDGENSFEDDDLVKNHGFDAKIAKKAAMFGTLDEERFAFARALSRLSHMSTQDWVDDDTPRN